MAFLKWIKWYFYDRVKCEHEPGEWRLYNMGHGKVQHCKKCGYCTGIL